MSATFRAGRIGRAEVLAPLRRARRQLPLGRPWLAAGGLEPNRLIFDAQNSERLPGRPVRSEGDGAINDAAVDEAYDDLGSTYEFFQAEYGRNSIDNAGMPLRATVHFGRDYDNAFWDGEQMVFGDGDGVIFNRFTIAVDITAHELAHGVTEHEAGLVYWAQAGALNESVSDVFGSLVKQYTLNQNADEADWLIGEGLFAPGFSGKALRSLKDPGTAYDDPVLGKDPQPGHMDDYVNTFEDNGGVHINSGIPNRAFYLTATALEGPAWEIAGLIWYVTLRSPRLRQRRWMRFRPFARLTCDTARMLYPHTSIPADAVRDAWDAVGISV